jgi:ABC transport system ATP-binding/permease protein
MNILDANNFVKSYGVNRVLQEVSFTVGEREKVGLIGKNGCGKSTLFRLVAKLEPLDSGEMTFKRGASLGYLSQDPLLTDSWTVAEEIELALEEIRAKLTRYKEIGKAMASSSSAGMEQLLKEQESLGHWLDHHGGWQTDHRIDEVLSKLGVPDRDAKIGLLSGGVKKRVALAKLILQSPQLLLLDEPTNHLDTMTTQWLEEFLISYPGAVMLITHDRYFLDRVAQRIFELESAKIYAYAGGYSDYLQGRAARLLHEGREQSRLAGLLRRESEWMERGPKARRTKQKARIQRFYASQDKRNVRDQRDIGLRLKTDRRLGHTILELVYLCKSFGEKRLLRDLSLNLRAGDRIGVIGPNGSGKTTLLRIILGDEHSTSGKVIRGSNTKISYFDQNRECLDPEQRVEEALGEGYWVTLDGKRRHKTSYLGDFLFEPSDQKRLIRTLSGGEKARLILARMMLEDANLLILDEPTNDLDIPTLQLLDDALMEYNGCVLMVTHDRFFLDKVATAILCFEGDGKVVYSEGNYEAYRERMKEEKVEKVSNSPQPPSTRRPPTARRKGLSFKEARELEEVERDVAGLEARKAELERFLADPAAHAGGREEIQSWSTEYAEIEKFLGKKIARWEVLEAKRGE